MTDSLGNQDFQLNSVARKGNMGRVLGVCALLAILLFLRAGSNVFFYVFVGVSLVTFLIGSVPMCMYLLLFLLPFSTITKIKAGDMTFFTVLFFVTVLKMLIEQKKIRTNTLFAIGLFVVFSLLFSGISTSTTIITMTGGLLMLYFLRNVKTDAQIAITTFSLGIVFASVLAMLQTEFPLIEALVTDAAIKIGENEYAARFSGLVGNPNYYTMDNTIALSALVVLICSKRISEKYIGHFLLLSVFGIMSVSKSFLICWAALLAIWLFLSVRQGVGKGMKYFLIITLCLAGVYALAFDAINTYLFRLGTETGEGLDSFLTGRLDIWENYFRVIFRDMKVLLFGNGLDTVAEFGRGTHNTYLDAIFYLGIVGSVIFAVALKQSVGRIVVRPIMWVPVVMLLVRMLAIGYLTNDNLWLYLALFIMMAQELKPDNNEGAILG